MVNQSFESWTLVVCKHFILYQFICITVGHMRENAPYLIQMYSFVYLLPAMPADMKGSNKGPPLLSVLGQLPDGTPGVVKGLHLSLYRSLPVVLWSASLALPFWCPIHLHLLLMMMVSILSRPQRANSKLLFIWDGVGPEDSQDSPQALCVENGELAVLAGSHP